MSHQFSNNILKSIQMVTYNCKTLYFLVGNPFFPNLDKLVWRIILVLLETIVGPQRLNITFVTQISFWMLTKWVNDCQTLNFMVPFGIICHVLNKWTIASKDVSKFIWLQILLAFFKPYASLQILNPSVVQCTKVNYDKIKQN